LLTTTVVFLGIAAAFGAIHSPWAVAVPFVCALLGLAVATPVHALSARMTSDSYFSLLLRFGLIPLGLFSGVYFPVTALPSALRSAYWVVVISGFFEPLLYLYSIGIGVGHLVGSLALPDGRLVPYAEFVAPAMLAASAMSGALAESTFNFFGKMRYMKLYDGILATPVRPMELATGELLWAMARGALYSAAFLGVMVGMG